jgi:hypothetical protein
MTEPLPTMGDVWGIIVFKRLKDPPGARGEAVAIIPGEFSKDVAERDCARWNADIIARGEGIYENVPLPMAEVWNLDLRLKLPTWDEYFQTLL